MDGCPQSELLRPAGQTVTRSPCVSSWESVPGGPGHWHRWFQKSRAESTEPDAFRGKATHLHSHHGLQATAPQDLNRDPELQPHPQSKAGLRRGRARLSLIEQPIHSLKQSSSPPSAGPAQPRRPSQSLLARRWRVHTLHASTPGPRAPLELLLIREAEELLKIHARPCK